MAGGAAAVEQPAQQEPGAGIVNVLNGRSCRAQLGLFALVRIALADGKHKMSTIIHVFLERGGDL